MTVSVYQFSPTGSTERIANALARTLDPCARIVKLAEPAVLTGDIASTLHELAHETGQLKAELAVFAVPVFGGRIPTPATEVLSYIQGNGIRAVSVVVYGNRDFDDALIELNDILARQGFSVFASAAFIAQHSMLPSVAAGRPDIDDIADAEAFARGIAAKLASARSSDTASISDVVPGNRPHKELSAAGWVPAVSEACTRCGVCAARCPVQAIPADAPNTTGAACFECMRCVKVCPEHARSLPDQVATMISEKLAPIAGIRKPNLTWL